MIMNISVYLADQNPHRDRSMGISNMTDVLLKEMICHKDLRLETICSRSSYSLPDDRILRTELPWRSDWIPGRLSADNLHPLFAKSDPDLWLYPKGYLPYLRRPSRPCVGIVHDTILLWSYDKYPEERSRLNYGYWLSNLKRSISGFDRILTVSGSAEAQIKELCARFDIQPPPIDLVYESPGDIEMPSDVEQSDYLVHIASRAPHKRTAWLIGQWLRELKRGADLPRLLLLGSLPGGCAELIESIDGIEKLPYLDEEKYRRTIAAARALIFPSEIEGFGLPALEAYLLGTPVCYVSGTAVEEVLGMPGHIGAFTLKSPESLFAALDQVCSMEPTLLDETASRLRMQYQPDIFADSVAAILRDML